MDPIIQVKGLRKTYAATVAVDNISFEVQEGEIFGMVGPNGAGKTTTVECLEGLRKPDAGMIRVLGLDPNLDGRTLRIQAGMQLQQSKLPERMRVWEALDLYSSFYPKALDWNILLEQLGLEDKRNTPFSKLSGGQAQRLFIALALLPDPRIIFLDELTTGLDPLARHAIWDLVREVKNQGKTVLLTTHFMEESEKLCDRVAILDHGRIVALDTPLNLIHAFGGDERIIFYVERGLPEEFVKAFTREIQLDVQGDMVVVQGKNHQEVTLVSEVVNILSTQSIQFHDLRTEQPNMEDVFLSLTGKNIRE